MELLGCVAVCGFIVIVIGAIMGMIAKQQTNELRSRLDRVDKKLTELSEAWHQGAARSAPAATVAPNPPPAPAPPKAIVPPPLPATECRPTDKTPEPEPEPDPNAESPQQKAEVPSSEPEVADARRAAGPSQVAVVTPPGDHFVGVEQALGMRWLTWVGVGLLFLGVAFFLKYAYDRDWLGQLFGPRMRIATAATVALLLAATGWRSLRNGMQALGQGLLGGGQALLYLTIFAAFQPTALVVDTPLFGPTTAFALMVLVTAAGLATAVRLDAIPMAFLAVLGGFATPVMVGSGRDARDLLCAYLLLLDLGVLLVASYRRWRALDLLAFAGTVVLFGGWFAAWHHAHPQPDATLAWLAAFHLVFVLLPFAHHWRHRTAVTVERFALALANLAWSLGYASAMLREPAPRLLAVCCLVGALLYLALGLATARRVGDDRRTRDGFLALATLLLTLAVFHLLPTNQTTTGWFAEAAVLLWLGYSYAHPTTRLAALAVLTAAMVRTVGVHLPRADALAGLGWNPWFATQLVAALGLAAFAAIHARFATRAGEQLLARSSGIGAGLWVLLVSSLEILRHANGHADAWTNVTPALAIAWLQVLGTLLFLSWAMRWRGRGTFLAAFLPLLVATIAVGMAYDRYPATAWPIVNGCCLAGLAVIGTLGLAGHWSQRVFPKPALRAHLFGFTQLAVTALATLEAAVWLQRGQLQPSAHSIGLVLGWVWLGLAVSGSLVAAAWSSRRVLILAAIPLGLAAITGLWQFDEPLTPHRLLGNQRFLFAVLVSATLAAMRPLLRRVSTMAAANHTAAAALLLLLVDATCEAVTWSNTTHQGAAAASWIAWLLGATAVAGATVGGWRARVTDNPSLRAIALLALIAAVVMPLLVYCTGWDAAWMFLNLRAGLAAAAIATAVWWARHDERLRSWRWIAFALALVALTAEPPSWLLANVAERAEAQRLALFSVTVTWIVIAPVLLLFGFRSHRRPVRLVALALFAATAAKLLLLDMSGAQQLYRILAFVLVGLVFVGASWLYHRVAKRLTAPTQ